MLMGSTDSRAVGGLRRRPRGSSGTVVVDTAVAGVARASVPATVAAGTGRVGGLSVRLRGHAADGVDAASEARQLAAPSPSLVSVAGRDVATRAGVNGSFVHAGPGGRRHRHCEVALDVDYRGFVKGE